MLNQLGVKVARDDFMFIEPVFRTPPNQGVSSHHHKSDLGRTSRTRNREYSRKFVCCKII